MSVNTDLSHYINTTMLFTWWKISSGCYYVWISIDILNILPLGLSAGVATCSVIMK